MINGLDLFSGIGGLSIALNEWVRPIAYCEIDPYCQGVLLSRIANGSLGNAPIWDDIRSLSGKEFCNSIDIMYGGFPCQDISVAGHGKGLEGERSGLFFEIVRISKEIKPTFIFLENVPCITTRGGFSVLRAITQMGYDCRWCVISAASIGALHRRERWFLLAKSQCGRSGSNASRDTLSTESEKLQRKDGEACANNNSEMGGNAPDSHSTRLENGDGPKSNQLTATLRSSSMAASHPPSMRCNEGAGEGVHSERETSLDEKSSNIRSPLLIDWENSEPPVCGVAHGLPNRVDRIRGLGNAVVPKQAKEAFKILMGLAPKE